MFAVFYCARNNMRKTKRKKKNKEKNETNTNSKSTDTEMCAYSLHESFGIANRLKMKKKKMQTFFLFTHSVRDGDADDDSGYGSVEPGNFRAVEKKKNYRRVMNVCLYSVKQRGTYSHKCAYVIRFPQYICARQSIANGE